MSGLFPDGLDQISVLVHGNSRTSRVHLCGDYACDEVVIEIRRVRHALAALLIAGAAGCATVGNDPRDPLESINRSMFGFNQSVDEAVLKPVAVAYKNNLPEIVQTGVRNFFSNVADISISVNNLLQGKITDAANDGMRFALNTTIGGFGLLDWASEMGIEKHNEDFGQTLGKWGVGDGPYLVWPLLGPSTARDSVGSIFDIAMDPVGRHTPIAERNSMYVTRVVGRRADLLDASRLLEEIALDKYAFMRDAYLQRRRSLIYDGNPPRDPGDVPRGDALPDK
jgi:phospholipid-binding lipoprotein MlaA